MREQWKCRSHSSACRGRREKVEPKFIHRVCITEYTFFSVSASDVYLYLHENIQNQKSAPVLTRRGQYETEVKKNRRKNEK